jgi:hypothetical protein
MSSEARHTSLTNLHKAGTPKHYITYMLSGVSGTVFVRQVSAKSSFCNWISLNEKVQLGQNWSKSMELLMELRLNSTTGPIWSWLGSFCIQLGSSTSAHSISAQWYCLNCLISFYQRAIKARKELNYSKHQAITARSSANLALSHKDCG